MEKRFRALRIIGTIFKVLAWIVLVAGLLLALIYFVSIVIGGAAVSRNDLSPLLASGIFAILIAFLVLFAAIVEFLMLYAIGESIFLALAIEENTRESSLLLRNLQRI